MHEIYCNIIHKSCISEKFVNGFIVLNRWGVGGWQTVLFGCRQNGIFERGQFLWLKFRGVKVMEMDQKIGGW